MNHDDMPLIHSKTTKMTGITQLSKIIKNKGAKFRIKVAYEGFHIVSFILGPRTH